MRIVSLSENLKAVEVTATLLNDPPPPGYTYWFPVSGFGLTSLQSGDHAIEVFRGFLRELIAEWARCGRKLLPENAEVRASGMGPAEGYSTGWEWSLCLVPKSEYHTGKLVRQKALDTSDPAYASWLWRVYWDYLHRQKPNTWFNSGGEVFFNYTSPIYSGPEPFVVLPPFLDADSPDLNCWSEAVLWFILLINSGYVSRLDRCTFCERYFVRKRETKTGHVYKRGGATCGNCRGETSKARTNDNRANAKDIMLDIAARAWGNWKQSHRTPDRYSVVAHQVTKACRREIFVTTRKTRIESLWVKRNEAQILARVELNALNKGAKMPKAKERDRV